MLIFLLQGSSINLSNYQTESFENDDNVEEPSRSRRKIDQKIWKKMLNDAQMKAQDRSESMDSKLNAFKNIYVETIGQEHLQSITSQASAGIAKLKIIEGIKKDQEDYLELAIDGILADISEITLDFVTPNLLVELASAFILLGKIPAAAIIGLYGLTNKPNQQYFELLMLHIQGSRLK